MPVFKIGFVLMVIVVSAVSYYCTNLVNPIPRPNTAEQSSESGIRTVANIEEKIEKNIPPLKKLK